MLSRCSLQVFGTAWVKLLNDGLHFVGPVLLNRIVNFVKGTGVEGGEAAKHSDPLYI